MPTFGEDVVVDGSVTVRSKGDGAILLSLADERHWEVRQLGTGETAALELASVGGGGNKTFVINTSGHVGIGTTEPAFTLDVKGGARLGLEGDGVILLNISSERHWELRQLGSGEHSALELASVGGGGNKNLIINTTGRVGIGTTTPKQTLDVEGTVGVSGDVILTGSDFAEDFDIDPGSCCEPGTVMVLESGQRLRECLAPYDRLVAGVVAGAAGLRPGIVLGRDPSRPGRVPIALSGRVSVRRGSPASRSPSAIC